MILLAEEESSSIVDVSVFIIFMYMLTFGQYSNRGIFTVALCEV